MEEEDDGRGDLGGLAAGFVTGFSAGRMVCLYPPEIFRKIDLEFVGDSLNFDRTVEEASLLHRSDGMCLVRMRAGRRCRMGGGNEEERQQQGYCRDPTSLP